jgi:hypothetical protein
VTQSNKAPASSEIRRLLFLDAPASPLLLARELPGCGSYRNKVAWGG